MNTHETVADLTNLATGETFAAYLFLRYADDSLAVSELSATLLGGLRLDTAALRDLIGPAAADALGAELALEGEELAVSELLYHLAGDLGDAAPAEGCLSDDSFDPFDD